MRSLLLFRFGPRARSTSWGIALCTMFIVASFSVAGGLKTSTENLADNFSSEYSLITKSSPTGLDFFGPDEIVEGVSLAGGIFVDAAIVGSEDRVIVFAVDDQSGILDETFLVSGSSVLVGQSYDYPSEITLVSESSVTVSVAGRFSSSMFPSSWILGGVDLLRELSSATSGYNFAVARDLGTESASSLENTGFSVQSMIGIIEFLDSGVEEIQADATWVLIPSTFVIAVLAYSFVGSETSDRRHDIGIVKTVGAGRWKVLYYLMLNALVISAWGGALGVALGIVLSYGTSTVASALFTSVFIIKASVSLLVVSFVVTILAGFLGSLLPALKMTLTRPVEDLKEVAPFS